MAGKKTKENKLSMEIEIPAGINAETGRDRIILKKDDKEILRKLNARINVKINGNKIILSTEKSTKRERKNFGSSAAHIKNMIEGLTKGFSYKLKVASVHFPITVEVSKTNNEIIVKNFLGERKSRVIKLIPGVEVKVNKDVIEIESSDIEKAGQLAANIEKATKIRFKDRRVFQDGIFIVSKPGVEYL